ncbi:hypothetical protein BOSP111201_24335 [Bordetella sputigena]
MPGHKGGVMKAWFFILLTSLLSGPSFAYAAAGASVPGGASFTSRQGVDRQAFGQYVAGKMSLAFDGSLADIYPCGNRAVYYCQGLMVTAFEDGESTYWMDPETRRLSFTYFRKDIATELFGDAGLVLWPQAYVDHEFPAGDPSHPFDPAYRCAYPLDGDTDQRLDNGCGQLITTYHPLNANPDTAPCASLGIATAQQWLNKYGVQGGTMFCGFTLGSLVDAKGGMDAMTQVAAALQNHGPFLYPWNEVVLGPWPSAQAGRIPLMAFFILLQNRNSAGSGASTTSSRDEQPLVIAQAQQKRYYDLTNIFVPIIVISQANSQAVFGYIDGDQAAGLPELVTVFPQ